MVTIVKQGGHSTTATERMTAARGVSARMVKERMQLLSLLAGHYHSHLSKAKRRTTDTDEWKHVLCIHIVSGPVQWRLSSDDKEHYFSHLKTCECEVVTNQQKLERLALATDGRTHDGLPSR